MDSIRKTDSSSLKQQLLLAKLLLRKYGTLHEFHVKQLENYPIACCGISLEGEVEVNGDNKSVTFKIKTKRDYQLNGKEVVERGKYMKFFGKIAISATKYKEEIEFAKTNLNTWTKELLWGPETDVRLVIDGREII